MNDKLSNDILTSLKSKISEHIPEAVGMELNKVLTKAKEDSDKVEEQQKKIDQLIKENSEKNVEISNLRNQLSKHDELDKREKDLKNNEDNFTVKTAQLYQKVAEDKLQTILGLVSTVFKEPRKVTSINEYNNRNYTDQSGRYVTDTNNGNKTIQENEPL